MTITQPADNGASHADSLGQAFDDLTDGRCAWLVPCFKRKQCRQRRSEPQERNKDSMASADAGVPGKEAIRAGKWKRKLEALVDRVIRASYDSNVVRGIRVGVDEMMVRSYGVPFPSDERQQ